MTEVKKELKGSEMRKPRIRVDLEHFRLILKQQVIKMLTVSRNNVIETNAY
jgi:hypothetical protein